jgi:tetratricopeptide (TPR) repeat protein
LLPTPPSLTARRNANSEAYEQYLLGRQFLTRNSGDDSKRAAQAFRKSIAIDPNYAAAWAGLADAMFWVADSEPALKGTLADRNEARAAADKAVALQPDLAYGYLTRAVLRTVNDLDFAGARKDLQRALALEPENTVALGTWGGLADTYGQLPEAIAALRQARADPLNARLGFLGQTLMFQGDYSAAHTAFELAGDQPAPDLCATAQATCYLLEKRPADVQSLAAVHGSVPTVGAALASTIWGTSRKPNSTGQADRGMGPRRLIRLPRPMRALRATSPRHVLAGAGPRAEGCRLNCTSKSIRCCATSKATRITAPCWLSPNWLNSALIISAASQAKGIP